MIFDISLKVCVTSLILFIYVSGFTFAYCLVKFDSDAVSTLQSLNTSQTVMKSSTFQQSGIPHKTVIKSDLLLINCHSESQPQLLWKWSHPADNTETQKTQKVGNQGEVWNLVFYITAISCNIGIKDQKQNSVSGQVILDYQQGAVTQTNHLHSD